MLYHTVSESSSLSTIANKMQAGRKNKRREKSSIILFQMTVLTYMRMSAKQLTPFFLVTLAVNFLWMLISDIHYSLQYCSMEGI